MGIDSMLKIKLSVFNVPFTEKRGRIRSQHKVFLKLGLMSVTQFVSEARPDRRSLRNP